MPKPHILQLGPYPEWDQTPLDAAFICHRLWEQADKTAYLRENADKIQAIATNGGLGAGADLIAACPNLQLI